MKIVLRDVTEGDLPILFVHQDDPDASRMAAFPTRDRETFFAHWRTKILGNPRALVRAIEADGVLAGNIGSFDDADGNRLVGYWLGRESWGRGIASRALAEFLRIETRRPLRAHVAAHNTGSVRVLEKNGFVKIAEHREPDCLDLLYELAR